MADVVQHVVYVKPELRTNVQKPQVLLEQVATVYCAEPELKKACQKMAIFRVPPEQEKKSACYVFSVLAVVERLQKNFRDVQVMCLGEPDFIVDYRPMPAVGQAKGWELAKTWFVAAVAFVGGAFAIMTFNNDGDVLRVFERCYALIMGAPSDGRTPLEFGYALGVPLGILVFFNHFGGKHFTKDPTPIEVEMRVYEEDVDTTLIKNAARLGKDVDAK